MTRQPLMDEKYIQGSPTKSWVVNWTKLYNHYNYIRHIIRSIIYAKCLSCLNSKGRNKQRNKESLGNDVDGKSGVSKQLLPCLRNALSRIVFWRKGCKKLLTLF